jgi:hypothetical protein
MGPIIGRGGEMLMDKAVIMVGADGRARLDDEKARIAKVRASGKVPAQCGPEIPDAPARGPVRVSDPVELVPGGNGKFQPTGHFGRSRLQRSDVFDVMDAKARAAFTRIKSKDRSAVFEAPFNAGQVSIARHYVGLHESLEGGGLGGSAYGDRVSGGGGGLDAVDLRLAVRREFDALERKVGGGVAMPLRKIRPSQRAGGRDCVAINDLAALRLICLADKSLGEVLAHFGWSKSTRNRDALRGAVRASLDRMQGYR